jgi:predicted transposase/invertase (TIGR01784 family)
MKKAKTNLDKAQANKYDKILKENLRVVTPALIDKVLKIKAIRQESIPSKLQHTKEREADFLKIMTDNNGLKFILHLEFQLAKESKMKFRMLEYYTMLRMNYDIPIVQYVIFIGNKPKSFDNEINEENLTFRFNALSVRDIDYRHFLDSELPEEIIFSILANFGNEDTENVVDKIIQSIKSHSKSSLQQQKCFQQLRILSNLRNFKPLIEKIMESVAIYIKEENDVLYQKGMKNGIQTGVEKGVQTGKLVGDELRLKVGIRNMLAKGFLLNDIAELMDISMERLDEIIKKYNLGGE